MGIQVDTSNWPILIVLASGDSSDDDLRRYLLTLASALARQEPHVVIVEASQGRSLKGTHRKMVADWNRENASALKKFRRGLVLVTDSALLRGMITAVYWIFPAPFPYHTAENFEEGWKLAWRIMHD